LVTHNINHYHVDYHTPYQPYAIPMVCYNFTSHTAPINRYKHTHNTVHGLACKVQDLHNAANTIAHSNCLRFHLNSLHRAKRTHRGQDFQKQGAVFDTPQFSLKI